MAISNSYISPRSAKLREKMKLYFSEVLKNNNFQTLESLDKIQSWYKEKYEIENTNVDIYDILSTLTNKIIEKLLEYSEPHYEDTIS